MEGRKGRGDSLTPFVLETFDRRENQPAEEEEEARGNMWRRQLAARESEGSGRNQSQSLAASRGELLIPISGELVRGAKKKITTGAKTLKKEMETIDPNFELCWLEKEKNYG